VLDPGDIIFVVKGTTNRGQDRKKTCCVYYQNVRGLRSKTQLFRNNVEQYSYDFIALTETFLTSSVCNGELFPPGYRVIRQDRIGDTGWGGVLLAVKESYSVHVLNNVDGLTRDKELVFVIITTKNIKLLCCVAYLPPNYKDEQYLSVLTCIENVICKYSDLDVILLGDFNLNSCSTNVKGQFDMFCSFCGLDERNHILNNHGGMLDVVLCNLGRDLVAVHVVKDPLVPIDQYHPPLEIEIKYYVGTSQKSTSNESQHHLETCPQWNWRKADFLGLYSHLGNLDWSDVLESCDVNAATDLFYQVVYDTIDLFVPYIGRTQNFKFKYSYPKWYSSEIIWNIQNKYYHLKKYKSGRKLYNKELFKYYRSHVKFLINNAYKQHIKTVQTSIIKDPVEFWKYVKDKKAARNHMNYYSFGERELSGQAAADAFAEYFSSVFQSKIPSLDPAQAAAAAHYIKDSTCISLGQVNSGDLRLAAKRLKPGSSSGPDGIPVMLAKDCMTVLECPLLHIFNLALQHSNFPECWKLSKVTPVPKGEAGGQASNYRPIAVLSVFGKVFESVVNRLLMNQISSKLHSSQHGFRQARSTTTNLVTLVDYIHREMDAGRQVDATYFDFRKAFDLVDNDILLEKLAKIGFVPNLLKFFCSYLGDRRQFVKINGYESDCYFTRSGVSQGSTLGPTLFLIMINDLPLTVHTSTCLMFADDLKLCLGIRDARDSVALQNDVNAVATWSLANNLPFNDTKCKAITFSRKRSPIDFTYTLNDLPLQRVLDIRDLGLVIDSKLDLHKHMTNICKNASKLLGFIIRTAKNFDDIRVARVLFNTLVRSRLEYASVVWDPYEDKYRLMIERIQRKFSRWLYAKRYGHYPYLYPSLFVSGMVDLETLALRREMNRIVLYLSIIHNKIDSPAVIERINLAIPTRLPSDSSGMIAPRRRPRLLERPVTRTKSAAHAPTTRALIILGDILAQNADLDLFADGLSYLCNKIYVYLSTC
jgi:hypothetical protein